MKSKIRLVIILLVILIQSCTFTTTVSETPKFKNDLEEVADKARSLLTCENININGVKIKTNGKAQTILEIQILNPTDLPTKKLALQQLAKEIAHEFKTALENQQQFLIYKIQFIAAETTNGVSTSKYEDYVFESADV